jgi:hypothetical protein
MKLLIIQSSTTSRHFILLRSKCSPQHFVLEHPQSIILPNYYLLLFEYWGVESTAATHGLLYLLRVIVRMENLVE